MFNNSLCHAGYLGRTGALAVALGIGAAVTGMPVAFADTTGSGGSSSRAPESPGAGSTATAPKTAARGAAHAGASRRIGSPTEPRDAAAAVGHRTAQPRAAVPAAGASAASVPPAATTASAQADTAATSPPTGAARSQIAASTPPGRRQSAIPNRGRSEVPQALGPAPAERERPVEPQAVMVPTAADTAENTPAYQLPSASAAGYRPARSAATASAIRNPTRSNR